MTASQKVMSLTAIVLLGTVLFVGNLTDVGTRVREYFPSAEIAIHEGHSPGVHPLLSLLRLVRGQRFVPASEWISVTLENEPGAVDFAKLFQFRVVSVHLAHCRVDNLAPLIHRNPPVYAVFNSCDLNAVPQEQKTWLRVSLENSERLTYGGP